MNYKFGFFGMLLLAAVLQFMVVQLTGVVERLADTIAHHEDLVAKMTTLEQQICAEGVDIARCHK